MTDTKLPLWTLRLLCEDDFDTEGNSWSWEADLTKLSDGGFRAKVTQAPGAPGDEDWTAAELCAAVDGAALFQFLDSAWTEHTGNKLNEDEWAAVAVLIRERDEGLAAEFAVGVQDKFHPAPVAPRAARSAPSSLEVCVWGARWDTRGAGGAGGLGGVVFNNLRRRAAQFYAQRYLERTGALPTGSHHVVAQVGTDFAHPMGGGRCSLAVEITFPGAPAAEDL